MNSIEAVVLGTVQGLTEFLPVSSSGHLVLMQHFLRMKEPMVFFDVMLHLGTLLAVFFYFRRDLWALTTGFFGRDHSGAAGETWSGTSAAARRYVLWIVVGTVPAGIAGVALNDVFKKLFENPQAVSVALLATGTLLFVASRARVVERRAGEMSLRETLIVGVAQAVAVTPGISRSGATICAGLLSGMERSAAARFSFMLSIPAILGATALELKDAGPAADLVPTLLGAGAACLVGLLALKLLFGLLRKGKLAWFAVYCWALGVASLAALALGL